MPTGIWNVNILIDFSDDDDNESKDLIISPQNDQNHHAYNPLQGEDSTINSKNFKSSNNKNTISGIFKILVQFYQVESMLRVDSPFKTSISVSMNTFMDFIVSFFNIKIISDNEENSFSICPMEHMTALGKEFIMSSIPLTCLLILLVSYIINQSLNKLKPERGSEHNQILTKSFTTRIKVCVLQLFLIGYVTISLYLLKLVHCIDINGINVVYVQGDSKCYQSWQYLAIAMIICWVVPFCVSLYFSSQMLMNAELTPNEFLVTLFVPAYIIVKKIQARKNKNLQSSEDTKFSLDTQERKNLIAILTGPFRNTYKLGHPLVFWESVMILRRLILCLVYVFVNNVVVKLYLTLAVLILCLVHHGFIRAFTRKLLNIAETVSLAALCFLCGINLFWAYSNSIETSSMSSFRNIGNAFLTIEVVALLTPIGLCLLFILYSICNKIKQKLC